MKYQLVLQFSISGTTDFDELIDLESRLLVATAGRHTVEGHDFGPEEFNILIHTDDPEAAFGQCKALVSPNLLASLKSAYRSLPDEQFHWVYPPQSAETFTLV